MRQEDLKMLESLLWEFKIQYSNELKKSELRSIIEVTALLITKIKNNMAATNFSAIYVNNEVKIS